MPADLVPAAAIEAGALAMCGRVVMDPMSSRRESALEKAETAILAAYPHVRAAVVAEIEQYVREEHEPLCADSIARRERALSSVWRQV